MGTLATKLVLLPPKDPESKGVVERRNSWFETSFMLGRTFDSPGDFNAQFTDWLTGANARAVRTVKAAPTDLLDTDRAAMLPLPPIPLHLGWHNKIRLGRDHYVRLDTNDYSVDTHRDSHTAAVIDAATGGVVEHLTVATDVFDYRRLRTFTDVHTLGRRVWAIEGTDPVSHRPPRARRLGRRDRPTHKARSTRRRQVR